MDVGLERSTASGEYYLQPDYQPITGGREIFDVIGGRCFKTHRCICTTKRNHSTIVAIVEKLVSQPEGLVRDKHRRVG